MSRSPRPFQERVLRHALTGKNVVLQAPTGSGKTRAALEPFIANLAEPGRHDLPGTCRYAVPLRTLANQFYAEHESLSQRMKKEHFRLADLARRYGDPRVPVPFVAEQTGEVPQDPKLEAALTFCTIDQLLAAFLALPYAVGTRKANLKVGGVVGSYLLLDEWHLYPLRGLDDDKTGKLKSGARLTALAMLKLLAAHDLCRFVLMTATLSTPLVAELADLLGASVENLRQGARPGEPPEQAFARELAALHDDRSRMLGRADRPLEECVDAIMERHRDSSLVVCNTVQRAQIVYRRLLDARERQRRQEAQIILLHSRFASEDRQRQSALLDSELGKDAWEARARGERPPANVIVVATQVVEVGLNVSATLLHTDLAPANSIVQRAGRCARFAGQQGEVTVYPLAADATYLPYGRILCLATGDALPASHRPFGFGEEQILIDAVHGAQDRELMESFRRTWSEIEKTIFDSLGGQTPGKAAALIRDVRALPVLIHDNPNDAITTEPWRWQAFSLHPGTLISRWDHLQRLAAERDCEWVCKKAVPVLTPDPDSSSPAEYCWTEVTNPVDLNTALMVVLPTALAHYDSDLGFALRDEELLPRTWPPQTGQVLWQSSPMPIPRRSRGQWRPSEQQSYLEHISGLLDAYQLTLRDDMAWVAERLEKNLALPAGSVDLAVRVAIACHDVGKLTVDWQRWARAWHEVLMDKYGSRYAVDPRRTLLAKTDYDHAAHRELQQGLHVPRPRHACEGVELTEKLVYDIFQSLAADRGIEPRRLAPLVAAVRTAMARHHTSDASECKDATLAKGAVATVAQALDLVRATDAWRHDSTTLLPTCSAGSLVWLVEPKAGGDDALRTWLYFVVVRALRLADQRADGFRRTPHSLVPS